MLDGQMAPIDDYLEVRPHEADRIRRLATAGRLSVGPWYILMDELLVSGETMVRNLQRGLDRAAAFGGAMDVGYLPDMFGHIAQMPQLLAQFGFEHTVVWRGVPEAVDAEAFTWVAPDGSAVRAEYLSDGYSNGAILPLDAKELVERVDDFCARQGPLVGDPVLWMNGTDHLMPQPWLGRVVAEANRIQDDYELRVTSLADHVRRGRTEGLPVWTGELRSSARTNLLMGTASNRIDVKQAAARAERALERLAEPLAALFQPPDVWPQAFLDLAWLAVIHNCAHDSICACSHDEVDAAVLHRYAEAARYAQGVTSRALDRLLGDSGQPLVIVNPTARPRTGVVELIVTGEDPPAGCQSLRFRPDRERADTLTRATAAPVVIRAAIEDASVGRVTIEPSGEEPGALVVTLDRAHRPRSIDVASLRARLAELVEEDGDGTVHLEVRRPPTHLVATRVTDVDGFGWRGWSPEALDVDALRPLDGDRVGLTNGLVTVEVDQADGTWSLNGVPGFGRLVDDGDAGDTYNWSPPAADVVVDRPVSVAASVSTSRGPVVGRLDVVATYRIPAFVVQAGGGARSLDDAVDVAVRTSIELRAGDDVVRVSTEVDNRAADHRLRVHLPLPQPAASSVAETAFDVIERGLTAEGGPTEFGLPTFPARRFVTAGGLTVVNDGLPEFELVDIDGSGPSARARTLALTLLRCTGLISNGPMALRPVPAGPATPTPAAQMPGRHRLDYAVHVAGRSPFEVADEVLVPLQVARRRGAVDPDAGDRQASGQALSVTGAEVSAVHRVAGRLEVRVFNPSDEATTVRIDGHSGWLVDLRGRASEPFTGSFDLRPHGIQTVALDGDDRT